jgi:hypothetical protein
VFLLGALFAFLVGMACLAGAVKAARAQRRKRAESVAASGVVVELTKRVFRPGSAGVYCPVVEFRTGSGEVVRFESAVGTMPASHSVGQALAVLYDPGAPGSAEIDSGLSNWLTTGCLLAFGALGLVFGLVFAALHFLLSSSGL